MKKIIILSFFLSCSAFAIDVQYNGKMYNNVDVIGVTDNKIIIQTEDGHELQFPRKAKSTAGGTPMVVNIASLDGIEKCFSGTEMSSLKKDEEIQKYIKNKITIDGFKINGEPVTDPNTGLYVFMVQDTRNRCRIKVRAEGDDNRIVDLKQGDRTAFKGMITDLTVNDIRGTDLQDKNKTFDYDIALTLQNVQIINIF